MGNKLIVANLKMYLTKEEIDSYIDKTKRFNNFVVCPTSIYIPYFLENNFKVGIQNIFYEDSGAYTGEVSPLQISSLNVKYVILGHSERRNIFKEKDDEINKKVILALNHNLKVILCVGEKIEDRNNLETNNVLERQLNKALSKVTNFSNIIIAYEPVWAIGNNKTASNNDIREAVSFIKEIVKKNFGYDDISVLYGGSVNDKNIENLNLVENISGYLIGGASLDPDKLSKIIEVAVP